MNTIRFRRDAATGGGDTASLCLVSNVGWRLARVVLVLGRVAVLLRRVGLLLCRIGLLLLCRVGLFLCRVGLLLRSVVLLFVHGTDPRGLVSGSASSGWHGVGPKLASVAGDGGKVGLPLSQLNLSLVEDVLSHLGVLEGRVGITRNDGGVVKQLEQRAGVLGKQDLLLGALDDGSSVDVVCLLELLAGDVGQLSLGDKRLGLCTDKLLLEGDDLGRAGLLVLELLDLVLDLQGGLVCYT